MAADMDVEYEFSDFEDDNDGFEDNDEDGWDDEDKNDDNDWGDVVEETDQAIIGINKPDLQKQISAVHALSPEDIDVSVESKVKALAEELSLEPRKCLLLLRRYKWNATKIIDVYFTDSDKILVGAGVCIDPKQNVVNDKNKNKIMEC